VRAARAPPGLYAHMPSIQSLGIGSGLLTSELVEDIIAAQREATDLRIDAEKAEVQARISSFGSIQSTLEGMRSAAESLGNSNTLLSNLVSSSNPQAVSATADATATPGVHSVEVVSLARSHTLRSERYDDVESVVGDGTLTVRFGTTTFAGPNYDTFTPDPDRVSSEITIDSSNNTLGGVRDAINEADVGVIASIVNDGEGYILVLTSEETGEESSMEISVTEGAVSGLSALAFNETANTPGVNMTQSVAADDARMSIDGILIRRDSNDFDEVVPGVTFNALSLNVGAPATVTIAQDSGNIAERVQGFVDAYNSVKSLLDQLTDFDEDTETGALLMGDATLRGVRNQIQRFLSNTVTGVESAGIRSLVDLGITTNQNAEFRLQLDVATLQSALTNNPKDVAAMLADQKRASDDLIRFTRFQSSTQQGEYDVVIERMATQGSLNGSSLASLAGPITIDSDNDELTFQVNGVTSQPILLTQGSYADGAALAQELSNQINADDNLDAAGFDVSVVYNATDERLEITSSTFGGSSQVGISSVDTATEGTLGLVVDTGESGRGVDVAGTVNGIQGSGIGQFLTIPSGPVPATSGRFVGAALSGFESPLTLDAGNNNFSVAIDSIVSGTITLNEGDYASGAELAAEMQTQINADTALSSAGKSVTVTFDTATNRLAIKSDSTSNGSTVAVTGIAPAAIDSLGLTVGSGEPGVPEGKVSDPASGAQIQVIGGDAGPRGSVTLVRGVMNQLDRYLDTVLNLGGTLDTKLNTLEARMADLDSEAESFDDRMDALEDRLRLQFAAADALISQLNSTSNFLEQQLSSLPGFSDDN